MIPRPLPGKSYKLLAIQEPELQHLVGQIISIVDVFELTKDLWWDVTGIISGTHQKISLKAALARHHPNPYAPKA